jgi:DNA (cytosine-5)-methyltransferase 1
VIIVAVRGYSYDIQLNRLWKLLIDRGITKTELKDKAGVSTNVIAKMGKGEPVSMESLAKVCTALKCGIDDIVDISAE